MTFLESVDILRGRFVRLKSQWIARQTRAGVPRDISVAIGVSRNTVSAFVTGKFCSERMLRKIEQWCDAQEEQR